MVEAVKLSHAERLCLVTAAVRKATEADAQRAQQQESMNGVDAPAASAEAADASADSAIVPSGQVDNSSLFLRRALEQEQVVGMVQNVLPDTASHEAWRGLPEEHWAVSILNVSQGQQDTSASPSLLML